MLMRAAASRPERSSGLSMGCDGPAEAYLPKKPAAAKPAVAISPEKPGGQSGEGGAEEVWMPSKTLENEVAESKVSSAECMLA